MSPLSIVFKDISGGSWCAAADPEGWTSDATAEWSAQEMRTPLRDQGQRSGEAAGRLALLDPAHQRTQRVGRRRGGTRAAVRGAGNQEEPVEVGGPLLAEALLDGLVVADRAADRDELVGQAVPGQQLAAGLAE